VIKFDEFRCIDLIGIFPSVIAFRVALPFDEILKGFAMSLSPMGANLFHFVFFFSINQVWWRSGEIGAV
jgi:hypothetical protein